MPATVPLDPPYRLSFSVPSRDTPTSMKATQQLLVEHAGRPLAMQLKNDGFTVGALEHIVAGSHVTYTPTADGLTPFFVAFPCPLDPDDERRLFSGHAVTAELVGGVHDGLIREPNGEQQKVYTEQGTDYQRTGYNPVAGVWVYQLVKQTEGAA